MPDQEGVEHEVQKRDYVFVNRIIADILAKQRQQPADLGVNTEKAKAGIDEHPFDLVHTKDRQVKNRVDKDRKTAVQIQKTEFRAVAGIGHVKAGQTKHQHVEQEKRINEVPGQLIALLVGLAVNR